MKKLFLIMTLLSFNAVLQSCTDDSVTDTEALYNHQADGEDDEIPSDPDDPDDNP